MTEEEIRGEYKEHLMTCMMNSTGNKVEILVLKCCAYLVTAGHHSNHNVATEHLPVLTQSLPGLEFGLKHYDQQFSE